MFLDFYGMREQPFGVTPDPRYLYLGKTHREALASLIYGIETGRGFMALIAAPGMGKTTLLRHLLEGCSASTKTALLFQTQCDSRELFRYLLNDLGVKNSGEDLVEMHSQLNQLLLREARTRKPVILFIDEAHNLEDSGLETVRLLSDFETSSHKLIQVILSGQPQLAERLAHPDLLQLTQRISILGRLRPFTPQETNRYINHRLSLSGCQKHELFTDRARQVLAEQAQGIPRRINNLCFHALSLGFALKQERIDASVVKEVVGDLDIRSLGREQQIPQPLASSKVSDTRRARTAFMGKWLSRELSQDRITKKEGGQSIKQEPGMKRVEDGEPNRAGENHTNFEVSSISQAQATSRPPLSGGIKRV